MYEATRDFLKTLSENSPALWTILVLGVITTLSLGLYAFWEMVLGVLSPVKGDRQRDRRPNRRGGHR